MFHFSFPAVTLGLLLTLLAGTRSSAKENPLPDTLQFKDTFNLEYASSPFFSPDGRTLFYQRNSMDIMQDRTHTTLWQIDLGNDSHRPVLAGPDDVSQATLSPDGTMLAYLAKAGGLPQIHLQYFDSGRSACLTQVPHAPKHLTWSPDGQALAFTMLTPSEGATLFTGMPDKPEGASWAEPAVYIEKTRYRFDGRGYLPPGHPQIYLLPVSGGTPRQLTTGNYPNEGPLSFSPDGETLYYATLPREDYALHPRESDLYQVKVTNREVTRLTSMDGPESAPALSPDGTKLAFKHLRDRKLSYQNADLFVMDLASGKTDPLTRDLDRSLESYRWLGDNQTLIVSYLDHGRTKLARVNLKGDLETLAVELGGQSLGRPYTSGDFAVSREGEIAYTTANAERPADLALHRPETDDRLLTKLNEDALGHLKLARVSPLPVTASLDKRPLDAWMAFPPDFDPEKKYPLILEIHGGPHAAYGRHFSMEIQLMAARGYLVVWGNPRGSASYGEDFGNLIHHNYPSNDYQDLMDVVDAAIASGSVDQKNLFITGGSGGGTLTAWSIGKTDRFAAAVVAKPVINWMSFALTADAYPFFSQYWMPKMPWEINEHLWQRSPLSLVGKVTTPTLLLTGEADYRTPISESEQFYQALRLRGVEAAMVRLPGSPHGIASKPSRLIQKVGHILAWFDRYREQ